jgi:hypothetical protein
MDQTLLALLALIIASVFSFNQERAVMQGRVAMVDAEMEVMASGVALQVMEYVGSKAFDDQTADGEKVTEAASLTSFGGFGVAGRCDVVAPINTEYPYQACDDLDDFHAMETEPVPFMLKSETLSFDVTVEVHYVHADGSAASGQTFDKKVVVSVQQSGAVSYLAAPVVLSRTFSYERQGRSS